MFELWGDSRGAEYAQLKGSVFFPISTYISPAFEKWTIYDFPRYWTARR